MTETLDFSVHDTLDAAQMGEIESFVEAAPNGSYLQMPGWPAQLELPAHHSYVHLIARNKGGQIASYALARLTPLVLGYRLASIRRGPVTQSHDALSDICTGFASALRARRCATLTLNPRWHGDDKIAAVSDMLIGLGAQPMAPTQQPLHQATLLVDLSGDADQLMSRIKQRGRRQIRKAEKLGLTIRHVETLEDAKQFEPLMRKFYAERQLGMEGIPPIEKLFEMTRKRGVFVLGMLEGQIVCGHVVIADGDRAFWLVMASDDSRNNVPKTYSMAFEAMRCAQAQGFAWYDMAGTPLETQLASGEVSAGAANRNQFKTAFDPVYKPLVPMFALPLITPAHHLLFGLRQSVKDVRRRKKAAA